MLNRCNLAKKILSLVLQIGNLLLSDIRNGNRFVMWSSISGLSFSFLRQTQETCSRLSFGQEMALSFPHQCFPTQNPLHINSKFNKNKWQLCRQREALYVWRQSLFNGSLSHVCQSSGHFPALHNPILNWACHGSYFFFENKPMGVGDKCVK